MQWHKELGAMEQIPVRLGVPAKRFWMLWNWDWIAYGSRTPCWSMLVLGTSQYVMSEEQPFFCYCHLSSSKQPGVMTCPGLGACLWTKCWNCEILVFCDLKQEPMEEKGNFPPTSNTWGHILHGAISVTRSTGMVSEPWAICIPWAEHSWAGGGFAETNKEDGMWRGPNMLVNPSKRSCMEKETSWWHQAVVLPEAACAMGSPEPYSSRDLGKWEPFLGPLQQAQLSWGIWKTQACTPLLCAQTHRTSI